MECGGVPWLRPIEKTVCLNSNFAQARMYLEQQTRRLTSNQIRLYFLKNVLGRVAPSKIAFGRPVWINIGYSVTVIPAP